MAEIENILAFVPDWVGGIGIFLLAILVAFLVYAGASKFIMTLTDERDSFIRTLFLRVRHMLRLALVLAAVGIAAQLPYFSDRLAEIISKVLSASVILMVGWTAMIAIDLASSFYLRKLKTGEGDDIIARKHSTQVRVLRRAVDVLIIIITVAAALMAFEPVRQFGVSLFASAGAAGLIVGFAARPLLSNLIAGIQLAITQPIRLNDAVIVEGEWGWVEEITATYVVIKIWDWRRLIVPLSYFMEKPFQNWTRERAEIIGTIFVRMDYTVPVESIRSKLNELAKASPLWDGNVVNLQVTELKDSTVELRILVSARTSPEAWDLRCEIREKILAYLQSNYPESLPRQRVEIAAIYGAQEPEEAISSANTN